MTKFADRLPCHRYGDRCLRGDQAIAGRVGRRPVERRCLVDQVVVYKERVALVAPTWGELATGWCPRWAPALHVHYECG